MMPEPVLYAACPRIGDVPIEKLYRIQHWVRAACAAGCGHTIVYPNIEEAESAPEVCYVCAEWLENTKGNA